jgi:hypothetical protein
MERRLVESPRWLIAGYSFGDEPVNRVFRSAALRRRNAGLDDPKLLVLDKAANEADFVQRVTDALRLRRRSVIVNVDGMPGSIGSASWNDWLS